MVIPMNYIRKSFRYRFERTRMIRPKIQDMMLVLPVHDQTSHTHHKLISNVDISDNFILSQALTGE